VVTAVATPEEPERPGNRAEIHAAGTDQPGRGADQGRAPEQRRGKREPPSIEITEELRALADEFIVNVAVDPALSVAMARTATRLKARRSARDGDQP
jgi:hypothetical protein